MKEPKNKIQESQYYLKNQDDKNQNNNLNNEFIPNINNNLIIQEVNELLMDQEQIIKKVTNCNKEYIELELSIPETLTQGKYPIIFLLKITMMYPKEEPELYCITKFSYPHVYDGRNLLKDVLKSNWNSEIHNLDIVINRIPKFIIEFNNSLEEGYLLLVGKYTINHVYPFNRIKDFPIFHQNVNKMRESRIK